MAGANAVAGEGNMPHYEVADGTGNALYDMAGTEDDKRKDYPIPEYDEANFGGSMASFRSASSDGVYNNVEYCQVPGAEVDDDEL